MRTLVASVVAVTLASASAPAARADNCYSNTQCPSGYICWGGQCQLGGSNGQTPSSHGGSPSVLAAVLGLVLIVGVVYWLRPGGPASSAETSPTTRALPPDLATCSTSTFRRQPAHALALTLVF